MNLEKPKDIPLSHVKEYKIIRSHEVNYENWTQDVTNLIIIMVGLPGRGKTYISKRICRWLNWKGILTKVFNAGSYRRKLYPNENMDYNWFDPLNVINNEKRENIIDEVCKDLELWLDNIGKVAILDATNSTKIRRNKLIKRFTNKNILFIETVCNMSNILSENIINVKLKNDDYHKLNKSLALEDFKSRVNQYEKVYEKLDFKKDNNISFIQLYNLGEQIKLNKIYEYLPKKISYFMLNLNPATPKIYITRHGQSQGQLKQIIGGNSYLTKEGFNYSHKLKKFMDTELSNENKVSVMCSTLNRSIQTASIFLDDNKYKVTKWKSLDEINGGLFEEYSYNYIKEQYPDIHDTRMNNKYISSWPGGETYRNMIARMENIFLEIERTDIPIIIIAHQAVCRGLYAYLLNMKPEECINISIPSHHIFEFYYEAHKHKFKIHDLT